MERTICQIYCDYVFKSIKGTNMTEDDKLLSANEVAEYLNLTPHTLSLYRTRKQGPRYIRLGKRIRYRVSDVKDWVTLQTTLN